MKNATPALCLSTGLFFTFVGVALSLQSLSVTEGLNNILLLLNGLKTSFWSSVVGLFISLVTKVLLLRKQEPQPSPQDFLKQLHAQHQTTLVAIEGLSDKVSSTIQASFQNSLEKLPYAIDESVKKFTSVSKQLAQIQSAHENKVKVWEEQLESYHFQNYEFLSVLKESVLPFTQLLKAEQEWFESQVGGLKGMADLKQDASVALQKQSELLSGYGKITATIGLALESQEQLCTIELAKIESNFQKLAQRIDTLMEEQCESRLAHFNELVQATLEGIDKGTQKEAHEALYRISGAMKNIIDESMDVFISTASSLEVYVKEIQNRAEEKTRLLETDMNQESLVTEE